MDNQNALEEVVADICRRGDVAALQSIIVKSPEFDLNFTTDGGVTLLMHTIVGFGEGSSNAQSCYETCRLLIEAGAARSLTSADTTYGRTAAHWAALYQQHQILQMLIEAGCDLTALDQTGMSPFHLAIVEKAIPCLQVAISLQPHEILECTDAEGRTPLMLAIKVNDTDVCQLLIEANCNTNAVHQTSGQTPLHLAIEMNNSTILVLLLRSGAELSSDASGAKPVHLAAILDNEEALAVFVELLGLDILERVDDKGLTPLMHACAHGNEKTVKYLIKKKVDVRARDVEGKSCLHWAAGSIYPMASKCLSLICKKAQDLLHAADVTGKTPLHWCAIGGTVDTLRALLECGLTEVDVTDDEQHTALHWAAANGNADVLAALADCGCPVSNPDIYGVYPIHYVVQGTSSAVGEQNEESLGFSLNCLKCLEVLLDKNAPCDVRDASGLQPLHWAAQYPNNQRALTLLLSHGADPGAQDNEGHTGLHVSAIHGHAENCQVLIEQTGGSIASVLDSRGRTALHDAAESGQLECINYFLSLGFSPDYQDADGRSPVHVAAAAGMVGALEALASSGVDLTQKTAYGATPLHEAAANGHPDAVKYLISCGLAVDEPMEVNGATPLHYAVSGKHQDCISLLIACGANVNSVMLSEEGIPVTPVDLCGESEDILGLLVEQGGVSGTVPSTTEEAMAEPGASHGGTEDQLARRQDAVDGVGTEVTDGASATITKRAQMLAAEILGAAVTSPIEAEQQEAEKPEGSHLEEGRVSQLSGILQHSPPLSKQHVDDSVFEEQKRPNPQVAGPLPQRPKRNSVLPESSSSSRPQTESLRPKSQADKKLGILERAFSVLKRTRSPPPESILSSTVGFYSAHATMLAAAIIGTPLGEKATEVAVKVITDTAEELKRLAAATDRELPDLIWLQEKTPTPPPPPVVKAPTPVPPTPPTPDIEVDPQEKRMRKALAQLDMTKSPGYLAAEELLKAQATHMKLSRQFQEARLKEELTEMRANFSAQEAIQKLTSELESKKMDDKIKTLTTTSEQVINSINSQLVQARTENTKISNIMAEMKIHPRPTVAQWLQQKVEHKKIAMQTALMSWDMGKKKRDASILVHQVVTSQRALQHAVWGARKELMSKLRTMKEEDLIEGPNSHFIADLKTDLHKRYHKLLQQEQCFPKPVHRKGSQKRIEAIRPPPTRLHRPTCVKHSPPATSVRFTSNNVLQFRERSTSVDNSQSDSKQHMWQLGEGFASGKVGLIKVSHPRNEASKRATGPKTVHAGRTLVFLPPDQYKAKSKGHPVEQPPQVSSSRRSKVEIQALNFDVVEPKKIKGGLSASPGRVQYHTLAGSLGRHTSSVHSRQPKLDMSVDSAVLPMEIINTPRTNLLNTSIAS